MKPETAKFRVRSFPHSSFADQSANNASSNVPNVAQVTLLSWPIARRYRTFLHRTLKSLVSFSHDSFADQSANDSSPNFLNVMQVTLLRWPIASCYRTFGHRKLESLVSIPHPSFADQSADDASPNVPNDSQGDIGVLANCKSLSVFAAAETKISGKKFPAPFICEPVR